MAGLNSDQIAKTIKLFIGGDFPRTESGRSFPVYLHKTKKLYANLCLASRKDFRNAVTAAKAASSWETKSAYNRGQILYRMAEMFEGKRGEIAEILKSTMGFTETAAQKAMDESAQAFVYYAGFTDKFQQVMGAVNPVSGPHHNFTTSEPVGTVGLLCGEKFDLKKIVAEICAIICSGNTVVALLPQEGAAVMAPLSEVFATSDLPKGVINLLTGDFKELYKHFASHMEVQSLSYQGGSKEALAELKTLAVENMKRIVSPSSKTLGLENILNYVEFKTVWHPIGY